MGWGLAAAAGLGAVGSIMGYQGQQDAMRNQNRMMQQQYELAMKQYEDEKYWNAVNYNMGMEQWDYQKQMDQLSQQRYDDERAYYLEQQALAQKNAERDRTMMMDRLAVQDTNAAQDREMAMQNYMDQRNLSNERISEERQMLQDAKAQQEAERQWQMDRIGTMDSLAERNRLDQLDQRNDYLAVLNDASSNFDNVLSSLGVLQTPEFLGEEFIDTEYDRLSDTYIAGVDRAADRVASINEADAIRAGVGDSSTGDFRRAEVAKRIAPMYQDAEARAMQDAIANAGGRNQLINTQYQAKLQERDRALQEANMQYQDLGFMRNQPQVGAGMETMGMTPNSAIFTGQGGQQLAGFNGMPSSISGVGIPQSYMPQNYGAPGQPSVGGGNPAAYMSMINPNTGSGLNNYYGNMANMYGNQANAGAQAFGTGMSTLINAGMMYGMQKDKPQYPYSDYWRTA